MISPVPFAVSPVTFGLSTEVHEKVAPDTELVGVKFKASPEQITSVVGRLLTSATGDTVAT